MIKSNVANHCCFWYRASYFSRLRSEIEHSKFRAATAFERDGIYIYKRPVRSGSHQHAALLAQGGSVFHHVVVYLKQNSFLHSLEFGPSNGMDITQNFAVEVQAAPILSSNPDHPEPEHLPMLHIDSDYHSIDAPTMLQAVEFAAGKAYHAMRNNCIAFADFIVRILTGNKVRSAPHIFDLIVGVVPQVDSPMLPLLQALTQMTWFEITDGSRLMREFLETHGHHAIHPIVCNRLSDQGLPPPQRVPDSRMPESREEDNTNIIENEKSATVEGCGQEE